MHRLKLLSAIAAAGIAATCMSSAVGAAAVPDDSGPRMAAVVTFAAPNVATRMVDTVPGANARAIGNRIVVTDATASERASLRERPDVVAVEADAAYKALVMPNDPCAQPPSGCNNAYAWQYAAMNMPSAWDISDGTGATIAVIDGGVDDGYADLTNKLAAPEIDVVGAGQPGDPSDHGTMTAALAAAVTNNGIGIPGTGWNARVLSYRVLVGTSPSGPYSGALSAVVAAIEDATSRGANVINLSLGGPDTTALQTAVNDALSHGVIVVAAAGNDGTTAANYPAAYPGVVAVGALDPAMTRASYSNFGSYVDVYAPGTNIVAPGVRALGGATRMLVESGTSFSSALVAGVASLLDAQHPELDSAAIATILRNTGTPIAGTAAPAVDAGEALRYSVPVGSLDVAAQTPAGITIAGWTIDPDTTAPIDVDIYVDGARTRVRADAQRPDLASLGFGTGHGFVFSAPATRGAHTACVWMLNDGGRSPNFSLGCRTIGVVSVTVPFGSFDALTRVPGGVQPAGWAIDPNTTDPVALDVWVNNTGLTRTGTGTPRGDVAAAYPGYGPNRGFDGVTVPAAAGLDSVCVWALDVPSPGINIQLGCRKIAVSNDPFGAVDIVARVPGGILVAGWALDPDVAASVDVHVYVDGTPTVLHTSVVRNDVAAVYPAYGAVHGFGQVLPASAAPHQVCIAAINQGAGAHVWLTCRQV